MTAISGISINNTVYIGGDSAGISGLSVTIRSDEKVFTNGPFLFGIAGSFRMGNILRYKFKAPKQKPNQTDMAFLVTDFVDCLRGYFMANGFGDKDATIGGTFLVGYKGKLYNIDADFQVGIPSTQYDAVGCGSDLALGSLCTTSELDMAPEERIRLSLDAASKFSAGVAPPFVILKQEYKPSKEEAPKKRAKIKSKSTSKVEVEVTPKQKTAASKKKKR